MPALISAATAAGLFTGIVYGDIKLIVLAILCAVLLVADYEVRRPPK